RILMWSNLYLGRMRQRRHHPHFPYTTLFRSGNGMMEVNAIVVAPRSFSNTITLSGSIEPNEQVQIRSEVSGIVRELTFREGTARSEEHTSELQSRENLVCRLLLEKKNTKQKE